MDGLFSPEFRVQGWDPAAFVDLLQHLVLPTVLASLMGVPTTIRTLRATMLDELHKP